MLSHVAPILFQLLNVKGTALKYTSHDALTFIVRTRAAWIFSKTSFRFPWMKVIWAWGWGFFYLMTYVYLHLFIYLFKGCLWRDCQPWVKKDNRFVEMACVLENEMWHSIETLSYFFVKYSCLFALTHLIFSMNISLCMRWRGLAHWCRIWLQYELCVLCWQNLNCNNICQDIRMTQNNHLVFFRIHLIASLFFFGRVNKERCVVETALAQK